MGAKTEVLPNSLLKERGSSTATWGGGTLGRVGGRSWLVGLLTNCFPHRFATTSSSVAFWSTISPPASQLTQLLTQRRRCPQSRPCQPGQLHVAASFSDWLQGHGGVFGLGMEGPEDDRRESESVKERVNGLVLRFSGRS